MKIDCDIGRSAGEGFRGPPRCWVSRTRRCWREGHDKVRHQVGISPSDINAFAEIKGIWLKRYVRYAGMEIAVKEFVHTAIIAVI